MPLSRLCAAGPKLKPDTAVLKAQAAKTLFTDDAKKNGLFTDVAWKNLADGQRQPYMQAAEKDKSRYDKEVAAYTPSPGWLGAKAFIETDKLARLAKAAAAELARLAKLKEADKKKYGEWHSGCRSGSVFCSCCLFCSCCPRRPVVRWLFIWLQCK